MIGNDFKITSRWDWRPESASEIGQGVLQTLDELSSISPHFCSWCFFDYASGSTEKGFTLDDMRKNSTRVVESGLDDASMDPRSRGYRISAHNSIQKPMPSPLSANLQVYAGGESKVWPFASFATSYGEFPDPSIVSYPVFKSVMTTLVQIWNVGWAQAFSHELVKLWDDPPFNFDLNWMTYLSAPLAALITPPDGMLIERTSGGGLLLIAAEETFDTANPGNIAAALSIRNALAPLNDLAQHELEKRRFDENERRQRASGFKTIRNRDL